MISPVRGTCWRCEYQAIVGIGGADGLLVEWAPANCAACGLVSVNVASMHAESPVCHECGAVVVLYSRSGVMPEPRQGRSWPDCNESTFAFSPAEP